MAMAYCETCGSVGNFMQCPLAKFPDEEGRTETHRVVFDETTTDKKENEDEK
tara:strand:- start:6197 stop:6352 length:156 start_codon:yes stop_codon:yes gene_type:complete